jgi:hypothetical protein
MRQILPNLSAIVAELHEQPIAATSVLRDADAIPPTFAC